MKVIKEHRFIAFLIVAAVLATVLVFGVLFRTAGSDMEKQAASIEKTIYDRALQCYVIEGSYPESLSYLEENYGLAVNKKDYTVVYTPYAENQPPEIKVIYRKK